MSNETTGEKGGTGRRGFIVGGVGAAAAGLAVLRPSPALGYDPLDAVGTWPWPAGGLDPVATAGGSAVGMAGCATTSFGLIANALKATLGPGTVWDAVSPQLASANNAGGPYGSDCGALQGPLFVMTLVGAPLALKQEFYKWYCDFAFPSTDWDHLFPSFPNTIQTVSRSPLCHESRAIWEGAFIREVYPVTGVYDTTRCSKLPRDCTRKAVELINAWKLDGYLGAWAPDESYKACFDCHTELYVAKEPGGIHSGKEDCTHCHDVTRTHAMPNPGKGRR